MRSPLRPADEARRLETLDRYDILDTAPEAAFDDLVSLAAIVCDAPVAMISLVAQDRQWFKAKLGVSVDGTARDMSFCGHAILGSNLFVIPDASLDERFADNPLVIGDPYIRFYAGAPLIAENGQVLGTLCVVDRVPRTLSAAQCDALSRLGRQVMAQLELRRQTETLASNRGRLLGVFAQAPVPMAIHRWEDRAFVDVNPAFTKFFGWTAPEIVGRTSVELGLVTSDEARRVQSLLTSGHSFLYHEVEMQTRTGDGRRILLGVERATLQGEEHTISTFVDITARAQIEIAANRLAAIVNSSDDAIIGKDLDGTVTSWNPGAEKVFGYSAREMIGASITRVVPEHLRGQERAMRRTLALGGSVRQLDTTRLAKDGRQVDMYLTQSPIRDAAGQVVGVAQVARDMTAERRAAQTLRLSDDRYRSVFDHGPDGMVITDTNGHVVDVNPSMCRMLGYSRAELIGMTTMQIVAPDERGHVDATLTAIRSAESHQREWLLQRKDGTTFPVDGIATLMTDGNVLGIARDITERQRIEARFRRLVDSNVQGVMFTGTSGLISDANDSLLKMLGYSRADLEAGRLSWATLTPPEYADADRKVVEQLAANGVCAPYEKEFFRKDGSRVPVLVGAAAFQDDPSVGVAFVLDLTERNKLEAQFLRAQRMESIGTLAGGIAHDLNNVLAPILMAVELLREEITAPPLTELLDTLQTSAERGAGLVKQVLTFARGVEGERATLDPVRIIRDLLRVMRETFPKSVSVRLEPADDVASVVGDATQLHQVFMNLCVNACDAMSHGGTLTVNVTNVVIDDTYAAMNVDTKPGEYVLVRVTDTGSGITPQVMERMFEPFFTTKGVGKGTGLGLSTSLAIVRSHGGFIHGYSDVGVGTTFCVYLPAAAAAAVSDSDVEAPSLPHGRGEVILLVDDEPSIRAVAKSTLERFGYRVLLAGNGAEAIALFVQHQHDVAAVVTDMAMPIMDGPATIAALRSIDETVKILGSSGLGVNDGIARAVGSGVDHFIPKPYTAHRLLTALRDVLNPV